MDLSQTWYDDRYYCNHHFDAILIDIDLESRSQECKKEKSSAPVVSPSFQSIWMEFGRLLKLVGVMNLFILLYHLFSIQMERTLLI